MAQGVLQRLGARGEEILERLISGPTGAAALQELAVEQLAKRQSLVAELQAAEAAHLKAWPALQAAVESAQAEQLKTEAAFKRAQAQTAAALAARSSESHRHDRRRGALERALVASAPPEVDALVAELRAELDERLGNWARALPVAPNTHALLHPRGSSVEQQETAREHVADYEREVGLLRGGLDKLRLAIPAAEQLKYEASDGAELALRIAAIRASAGLAEA